MIRNILSKSRFRIRISRLTSLLFFFCLLTVTVIVNVDFTQATAAFSDGYESSDFSAWTSNTGSPTISTSAHTGSYAGSYVAGVGSYTFSTKLIYDGSGSVIAFRIYGNLSDPVSYGANYFMTARNENLDMLVLLGIYCVGGTYYMRMQDRLNMASYDEEITWSPSTFHCYEMNATINDAASTIYVFYDGVEVISETVNWTSSPDHWGSINVGATFEEDQAVTNIIDDVQVATSYIGLLSSSTALYTSGTKIYNGNGTQVYLLGAAADYNEWKNGYFIISDVNTIKAAGGNCVEMHMNHPELLMPTRDTISTSYVTNYIDVMVNLVTGQELYCIINLADVGIGSYNYMPDWMLDGHGYGTAPYSTATRQTALKDFYNLTHTTMDDNRASWIGIWEYLADRYKSNPYVIFSLVNEPMNSGLSWGAGERVTFGGYYATFMEATIDAIRATGASNLVFIDKPYSASDWTDVIKVDRTNVVWEDHAYIESGHEYAWWAGFINQMVARYVTTFGQPLFIGEYATIPLNRANWADDNAAMATYLNDTDVFSGRQFHSWGMLYGEYDSVYGDSGALTSTAQNEILIEAIFGSTDISEPTPTPTPTPTATPTPSPVLTLTITQPFNRTYATENVTLELTTAGVNVTAWFNVMNGTDYVYAINQTYSGVTTLTGFVDGSYTLYAWASSDLSESANASVSFTIEIVSGELVLPVVDTDYLWLFMYEGDFLGALQAYLVATFLNFETAIAAIILLFVIPLYLRTKSLMLLSIGWILLGTFFVAAVPMAAGISIIFIIMGIGGLLYRLFRPGYGS